MRMSFAERLSQLGCRDYAEYLKSPHWLTFKARYRASPRGKKCAVCGTRDGLELHHHDYTKLGCETFDDVTPLCREHHGMIHDWLKATSAPTGSTGVIIKAIHAQLSEKVKKEKKRARECGGMQPTRLCGNKTDRTKLLADLAKLKQAGVRHPAVPDDYQPGHDLKELHRVVRLLWRATARDFGKNNVLS